MCDAALSRKVGGIYGREQPPPDGIQPNCSLHVTSSVGKYEQCKAQLSRGRVPIWVKT